MANPTAELRYHITVFDESGAVVEYPNLTRVDLDEFHANHDNDDLNYSISYDWMRQIGRYA